MLSPASRTLDRNRNSFPYLNDNCVYYRRCGLSLCRFCFSFLLSMSKVGHALLSLHSLGIHLYVLKTFEMQSLYFF